MSYCKSGIEAFLRLYDPLDVKTWPYYPIIMPLKEGNGPTTGAECDSITFEVWDHFCDSYGSFEHLPTAINEAMRLTKELLNE